MPHGDNHTWRMEIRIMSEFQEQQTVDPQTGEIVQALDVEREFASKEMQALLDKVDQDIIPWNPREHPEEPKVYGTVSQITEVDTGEYGPHTLIVIKTPSGRLRGVHCFHTVLRREIDNRIKNGTLAVDDLIAISYRGPSEKKSQGKNPSEMYRIEVARSQSPSK